MKSDFTDLKKKSAFFFHFSKILNFYSLLFFYTHDVKCLAQNLSNPMHSTETNGYS